MNRRVWTLALTLLVAGTFGSGRAADTPDGPAAPPKAVAKSWHNWTVKEIIRDFLVQVEFDARRSRKELNDLEKLIKERNDKVVSDVLEMQIRGKKEAAEAFEKLERDIRTMDRDLDETTRQIQWADKRFDKYRDRLDRLAKRVEKGRLPSVPFSMSHPFTSPELERLEEMKRQFKDNPECLIPEVERWLQEIERRVKKQNNQPEQPRE